MGANQRGRGQPKFWYPSMSGFMPPKRNPNHVVQRRSGPWMFYSGKTGARPFTMCAFCKVPQMNSNLGWMYRKHFNTGSPMAGPVTQHACPKCAKDPKKVDLAAGKTGAVPRSTGRSG